MRIAELQCYISKPKGQGYIRGSINYLILFAIRSISNTGNFVKLHSVLPS
jgi:hypothetical protein